ncbi:MAG: hypothetical protein VB934_01875, partial [Polyangiaceae bacterium]
VKKENKPEPKAEKPKDDTPKEAGPFNRDAARSALSRAAGAASGCARSGGPTGRGRASVTFSPSGGVGGVSVSAPFAGTSVGSCISGAFRSARVPPFTGSSVTFPKSFYIK